MDLRPGDTVRVWQKIEESKGKFRLQAFEGLLIARKHGTEAGATFTVRRVTGGVGVEKVYPLYTPMIDKVEIIKRARVRRAKLYYIREKVAREARRQLRRSRMMTPASLEAESPATTGGAGARWGAREDSAHHTARLASHLRNALAAGGRRHLQAFEDPRSLQRGRDRGALRALAQGGSDRCEQAGDTDRCLGI